MNSSGIANGCSGLTDGILITGATGFVGTHLVAELRRQGRRVRTHSRCDGDIARCALDFDDVGQVVHLAGRTFVPESWTSPLDFYDTNVIGTVNVLDFCRRKRIPLTFVSSYVYGKPHTLPIDESHPVQPFNPYSHSKILAEQAIRYFSDQFGVRATIVRPFNLYGAGQDDRFLVPTLVRQALDPACARIMVRDARPRRDFLHVRDFTALLLASLNREPGGIFNAGSGRSIGISELVAMIACATGCEKPIETTEEGRPDEVFDVVADISCARTALGWAPRIGLDAGVRDTVAWMQARLAAGAR
jgi:nucleoside-diphosphate-sugar epimerase